MKKALPLQNIFASKCSFYWLLINIFFLLLVSVNHVVGQSRVVPFTTAGTYSWTAPCGVNSVSVYVWGAGGGGGGANSNYPMGGGGGGGAFTWNNAVPVVPGTTYTITVGAGGAGGENGNGNNGNGFAGGNSSFANVIVVGGGQGGTRNPSAGFGERGYGITAPGLSWTAIGGNGANGAAGYGGGGGSTGSPNFNNAVNASGSTGGIAPIGGGNGGNGQTDNGNGSNGSAPGGGGGGARRTSGNHSGGNGADGRVEIRYIGAPSNYCNIGFDDVEPITLVNFAGINYSSSNSASSPEYELICSQEGTVSLTNTYTFTVKGNTFGNYRDRVRVFIDWNQNGVLNEPGEVFGPITLENSTGLDAVQATMNITVPAGATLGKTKMRVAKSYYEYYFCCGFIWVANGTDPTNPCTTTYDFGQAEDYVINVIGNCQQPTGATANGTSGTLFTCINQPVTLRQVGGAISADQRWEWTKAACVAGFENRNTNTDAAYTFTPTGPGTTVFFVKAIDGTCGSSGPCQSVTVTVRALGTVAPASGYNANFSACRTVYNPNHAVFNIGGGATGASATGLPAGLFGNYSAGTFTIYGTPTDAVGTYNYTINLSGNPPCVNPTLSGTITITDKPTISYTGSPYTYCIGGAITPPNVPATTNGGLTTTFSVQGTPLPAGLILNTTNGTISGTPTGASTLTNYTIRATNGCGFTDAEIQIRVISGNTVFNITPGTGSQTICSTSSGINIGLDGSVNGINYQLYRDGIAVGLGVTGTGAAISMGTHNTAGTYTVVATTSCATNMAGSFTINVTPQPTATFSYSAAFYCKTSANPVAVITGTPATNAVFSSTSGLVFANTTTGEIDLINSNVGSYYITYSAPAFGGCSAYSYSSPTLITIANSPDVFTVTGGGGYCSGAAGLPVGLTGSQAGVQYQLYRDGNPLGSPVAGTGGVISFGNQTIAGIYTVQAVMGSCTKNMDGEADIFINALPPAIAVTPATSTICQGTLIPLTATLNPPGTTTGTVEVSVDDDLAIPDNLFGAEEGTFHLLKVTGIPVGATITDVRLEYHITHNTVGQLVLNLKGPNGNVLNIANRLGGSGNDFGSSNAIPTVVSSTATNSITTYSSPFVTGPYLPQAAGAVPGSTSIPANTSNVFQFSGLYGSTAASANGNWFFSVRDDAWSFTNSTGTLRFSKLVISYTTISNPTSVTWTSTTDLYTDPAATTNYVSGTSTSTVYLKPSTSGTKTYTATATNEAGCMSTASSTITVNPSPTIAISANYCIGGGVVRITASSNTDITSGGWVWSTGTSGTVFGAGNRNSYIDVAQAGTYYVSAKSSSGNCPGTASMPIAQELVTNGDFNLGNVGFNIAGYTYYADDPLINTELYPQASYGIGTDAQNYHNLFWGWDHTLGTGDGNFMMVNGQASSTVWENLNVPVQPNTTYYFSAWGISLNAVSPFANLSFYVGPTLVATTGELPAGNQASSSANNNWRRFAGTWTSGPAQYSADIRIVNTQGIPNGNDFGLDDISFGTLTAFFNLSSTPGSNTQSGVCVGTNISDIIYEIGGDGNAPTTTGSLPPGVSAYWNGRTYRISGSPTTAGNFTYNITSSGCGAQTRTVTINVIPASQSGSFAAPIASACYNTGGSIAVSGSVGTNYTWQSSADGTTGWTTVVAPNSSSFNYPALINEMYYRVIVRNTAGCSDDTSDVVKVGLKNVWTGKMSDNWNTAGNWSDEQLPSTSPCATVIIPNTLPSKPLPILSSGSYSVMNIDVHAGAGLTILNDATLRIAGSITSASAINANDGTIVMNGATQDISGSNFVGKNIENLIVSGGMLNVSNTANDTLNITEKLSFGTTSSDLHTGNNITLKSTVNRTASVGILSSDNIITGDFVVERFVNYYQKWNLLTLPLRQNVSVRNSWQEGLNGAPMTSNGFGTRITGPNNPPPSGFDNTSPAHSLKWWDPSLSGGSGNWANVSNTITENANRPQGFYIFVRGDRGFGPGGAGSTTTLRGKGTIYTAAPGTIPSLTVTGLANSTVSVANPYPSAINIIKLLTTHGNDTKLEPHVWVWDPTQAGPNGVGGYQTISGPTGSVITPGGGTIYNTAYPDIHSGQAVFVQTKVVNPVIAFNEDMKEDGSRLFTRSSREETIDNIDPAQVVMLSTHLYTSGGTMLDGNRVVFDDMYSDEVDFNDAEKFSNATFNFGLKRSAKSLIVEAKSSLKESDTLYYNMSGLTNGSYKLGVAVQNINAPQLQAELIDNYLHTRTAVSLTDSSFINFTTTADAASKAANRFMMVFRGTGVVLPVTFVQVAAQRNADRSIDVQWKVANEINILRYEVERSADGSNFSGILTRDAANYDTYRQTDLSPLAADNFYRIKAIGLAGDITYSNIVKVAPEKSPALIVVSPNPVKGKQMHVRFMQQPAGEYVLVLTNNAGQEIYRGAVTVSGSSMVKTVSLHPSSAGGSYRLAVFNKKGERIANELIIVE